ncbi:MAG: ATP-binding protein, partial [Saprospiraceae bacterium]
RYTEADGLSNQNVLGIEQDSRGRLWLHTLDGVSVFRNPRHDARTAPDFKNYDRDDGLLSRPFVESSCLKTRSGLLLFGGREGFDVFNPDSIRDDKFQPPVFITSFKKFDTAHPEAGAVAVPGVSVLDEVLLSHKNNIFSIEFAALDFREPANNRYAYRLVGFNDSWVQIGAQREVTFTNLDAGTYTFEVRGTNSDGIWNEVPALLKITVRPPWWKSLWAYIAYALLFAAGMIGLVRARLRFLENRTRELEAAVTIGTAKISEQNDILAKQAEELQELDRLKSRFYANVTHELRTPLTLMLGPLNSVLKNWKADPAHRDLLQIAQANGRKLLNLVSEILDLGKLDANRMSVDRSPVAVQTLLARLVALFDSHARYLGVHLTCQCDLPPDWIVSLDAKKFETVVNNLLSNALKFTPPGGSIEVTLEQKQPDVLLLSVRDTGRGIHADDMPHVFDRYFQTKRPDTPVEGGTGIGLALSAELVRLCAGKIWVESRVGEGSTFWVEWPFDPDMARLAETRNNDSNLPFPAQGTSVFGTTVSPSTAPPAFLPSFPAEDVARSETDAPLKILVAEDNPDLQAYLHHLLAPEYDIAMVANGEEALAAIDLATSLIISDIMMPRMDGFQLLERLKNDDRFRHIPVVMLTARADIQDKLRALRTGVDDYLTKPFDEDELLARVRNLAQRQKNRAETISDDMPETPASTHISQADAEWLAELEAWTRANLHDEFLSVSSMAQVAALSERQLLRRMRAITGLSPQQYIAEMRMQKARESLEIGAFRTVAEAAYSAGFSNAKAFTRAYRERFGRLPSAYF